MATDDLDPQEVDDLESDESMFVQTATGLTSNGSTITLRGVTPSTLYFADRPKRDVGHLTTADFVDLWGAGDDSFASDPPNAVLSFVEDGSETPSDAVVVIKDPTLTGDELSYTVEVLEGSVPAQGGPVTLFIDPFGRPMSPVSVCGVRRRGRRRGRRRARRRF